MTGDAETTLELIAERSGDAVRLLAPDVGLFTGALDAGAALAPGQRAGTLLRLGRAATLVVPAGVRGIVTTPRPERVHAPVGHRTVLYELAPLASESAPARADEPRPRAGGLALRSPQSGRFYRRPAPDAEPFVAPGAVLDEGAPVGLIEVMKTFSRVLYRADADLPARARVVRFLAEDGADVGQGDGLLEVEEA